MTTKGFLESLRALVEEHPSLSVEATATDGVRATEPRAGTRPRRARDRPAHAALDGVAATRSPRRVSDLCVIALTGDESREIHQAVAEAGGDAVLLKSQMVENLAERLVATIPMLHPAPRCRTALS